MFLKSTVTIFSSFSETDVVASWGDAKGSPISWVAKLQGDKNTECELSKKWSRSYREIKMPLPAGKRAFAKFKTLEETRRDQLKTRKSEARQLLLSDNDVGSMEGRVGTDKMK